MNLLKQMPYRCMHHIQKRLWIETYPENKYDKGNHWNYLSEINIPCLSDMAASCLAKRHCLVHTQKVCRAQSSAKNCETCNPFVIAECAYQNKQFSDK